MINRALGRSVASDPRPAIGFALAMLVSSTALESVIRGSISIATAGSGRAVPGESSSALESILQVTVVAASVSAFVCARALALSLRPEFRSLRAVGGQERSLRAFGMMALTPALGASVGIATALSGVLARRWAEPLAELMNAGTERTGSGVAAVLTAALVLPVIAGWWAGSRQTAAARPGRARTRVAWACVTAVVFIMPTVLAVTFASELTAVVRASAGVAAAERVATLASADGPLAVLSAAVFGIVGATVILTPLLTRRLLAFTARTLGRGPVVVFVGLRLAESRTAHFGALSAVVVAASGLVEAHALTSAASASTPTQHGGAGLRELALTLGPALVIAMGCAVGAAFAQSRGTGTELRSLRRLGMTSSACVRTLAVGAVALGLTSVVLSTAAVATAWLVAVGSGLAVATISAVDLTAPALVSTTATTLFVVVFIGCELVGAVVEDRR